MAAVNYKIMPLRLSRDRIVDGAEQKVIGFRCTQRFAQIGGVFLAEAHIERAGASDSHAIA